MYQVIIKETMPITKVEGDTVRLVGYQVICENIFEASDVILTEHEVRYFLDGDWKVVAMKKGISVKVTRL